jgi:hypothetical protein
MNPEEIKHTAALQAKDSESLGRFAVVLEECLYADG